LLILVGPTASGKTGTAIRLARYFHTEIISADSRQFFTELEAGTAKPSRKQLAEAPHHFINSLSINQSYNAGKFAGDFNVLLKELFVKHDVVIMTGGSGLYIDAAVNGIDDLPPADDKIRKSLKDSYRENGIEYLQQRLYELDPVTAARTELSNPRRLMRALEICIGTGRPYSEMITHQKKSNDFEAVYIGMEIPRPQLYERIDARVDAMIANGLKEEVKSLLSYKDHAAMQTVGYKELVEWLEGKCGEEEAIEKIKQHTRNYAKRQMTWFRKNKDITWLPFDDYEKIQAFAGSVIRNILPSH